MTKRKELMSKGYMVEVKRVGANHANTGANLPLGMAFVLTKDGETINHHCEHGLAWAWAERIENQITPSAA